MKEIIIKNIISRNPLYLSPIDSVELFRGYLEDLPSHYPDWNLDYQDDTNQDLKEFLDYIVECSSNGLLPKSKNIVFEFTNPEFDELFIIGKFKGFPLMLQNMEVYLIDDINRTDKLLGSLSHVIHLSLSLDLISNNKISTDELLNIINSDNEDHIKMMIDLKNMKPNPVKVKEIEKEFCWIDGYGGKHDLCNMETSHLYYSLRMCWNHLVPKDIGIQPIKEYDFSANKVYTHDFFKRAIKAIPEELSNRNNMTKKFKDDLQNVIDNISVLDSI